MLGSRRLRFDARRTNGSRHIRAQRHLLQFMYVSSSSTALAKVGYLAHFLVRRRWVRAEGAYGGHEHEVQSSYRRPAAGRIDCAVRARHINGSEKWEHFGGKNTGRIGLRSCPAPSIIGSSHAGLQRRAAPLSPDSGNPDRAFPSRRAPEPRRLRALGPTHVSRRSGDGRFEALGRRTFRGARPTHVSRRSHSNANGAAVFIPR